MDEQIKDTALWGLGRKVRDEAARITFEATCNHLILPRPFRLVVFAGQKRSGNHVIINWFLSQSHGPCAFFNHVKPAQYPIERYRREFRLNRWNALPTVAFSYEDRDLSAIFSGALRDFIAQHKAQIQSHTLCRILRDPRNLMASRFRKWPLEHENADKAEAVMGQWKEYVTGALNGDSPDPDFAPVSIYYNRFITSRDYRSRLAGALDIRDSNKGLDTVTDYGHGSSFGGTGQPDLQGIFERWRSYEDDPAFQRLFTDPALRDLADRLDGLT